MTSQLYPRLTARYGPFISLEEAAEWTGERPDRIQRAFELGCIEGLHVTRRRINVAERSCGEYFGIPVPGPRELEFIAERKAREKAQYAPARRIRDKVDHWLYWFYDPDGHLLYIGITNSGVKRMEQHGAEKLWWPMVASIRVDHFSTRKEAETAERAAIKEHCPRFNGTHNPRRLTQEAA